MIFAKPNPQFKILVCINVNEWFEQILSYFEQPQENDNRAEVFEKTSLLFRGKTIDPVLGVKDLAKEVAEIIHQIPTTEQGAMIGIFGKWGRGKSYFIDKLWEELNEKKKIKRIDFHAWKYQDTPAIWAYLFEQFADKFYSEKKNNWGKFWRRISLNFKRLGASQFIFFLTALIISATISLIPFSLKLNFIWWVIFSFGLPSALSLIFLYKKHSKSAKDLFKKYYKKVSFEKVLGIQAEVQKELRHLIEVWDKNDLERIILFVDDIDRCSEIKIIEIIDALRVMLEDEVISKRVIVVAAIDEDLLEYAIRFKYNTLIKEPQNKEIWNLLVNQYLDKLFILGLRLGELSPRERDEFFIELTKKDRTTQEISAFIDDEITTPQNLPEEILYNVEKAQDLNSDIVNKPKEGSHDAKIESTNKTILNDGEINHSSGRISIKEVEILRSCLKRHLSITPRQIKIFYYRYVLTKNLLISQYAKNNRRNPWVQSESCRLLVDLIVDYSKNENKSNLPIHKLDALNCPTHQIKVHLHTNHKIKTIDYRELLKILDIVIAY